LWTLDVGLLHLLISLLVNHIIIVLPLRHLLVQHLLLLDLGQLSIIFLILFTLILAFALVFRLIIAALLLLTHGHVGRWKVGRCKI
jgi:hypothetical protein